MFEMLVREWELRSLIVLLFLVIFAVEDYKKKEITAINIYIFSVIGFLIQIVKHDMSVVSILSGISVGAGMLIISKLTKGGVGIGDGMLLMLTGIFLGGNRNFKMLIFSLAGVFIFSIFLLLAKKITLHQEIPFIPFLLASYIGMIML